MFDPEFQRKALSLVMGFIMQFSETPAEPEVQELSVNDLNVSTISVSCLKVAWDGEPDRDYYVSCTAHDDDYAYADNMYFEFKSNELCYITGLREGKHDLRYFHQSRIYQQGRKRQKDIL